MGKTMAQKPGERFTSKSPALGFLVLVPDEGHPQAHETNGGVANG
jgi:hypothetical protein